MKVLQRKRPQTAIIHEDAQNVPIQPMSNDLYTQTYGANKPQRFQQNLVRIPVQQQKSKEQLIEEQLRKQPAFSTDYSQQKPVATTRTGLKPRVFRPNSQPHRGNNIQTHQQKNITYEQYEAPNFNDNNCDQEIQEQQPNEQLQDNDEETTYKPQVQQPVHKPEDLLKNAMAQKNKFSTVQTKQNTKQTPDKKKASGGTKEKQIDNQTAIHNVESDQKQTQIAEMKSQIYCCKSCKTPLVNLTFLKNEQVNTEDLLCTVCAERKYKEIQLLQLKLINQRKQQTNQKLEQINSQIQQKHIETFNQKQELIDQVNNQNQQIEQQNTQIKQQESLVCNTQIKNQDQKFDQMNAQLQQLAEQLNNKNQQIIQLQEDIKLKQQYKQQLNDLSLSHHEQVSHKDVENNHNEVDALKQQLQVVTDQIQQLQNQKNCYTSNQQQNQHQHQFQPEQNKLLNIMQQMNQQVLQNFPFIIQRKVCSVCNQTLGMRIVDPRNQNQPVDNQQLKETISLQKELQRTHVDYSEEELYKMLQDKKRSKQVDLNQIDVNQLGSSTKKRKIDQLFRLEEKLAQLQIHANDDVIQKQGIFDVEGPTTDEKFKQETFYNVQNEAPQPPLNVEESSDAGDLVFGGKRKNLY